MENKQRNTPAHLRDHRRQLAWQIIVPMVVASLVVILGVVFVTTQGGLIDSSWAEISVIWLVAPFLLLGLVLLAVIIGLIYGLFQLDKASRGFFDKTITFFGQISAFSHKIADGVISPVVWTHQTGAVIKKIFSRK
jgi:hypothetical protein